MGRRRGPPLSREQVVAAGVAVVQAEGHAALGVSRVARELGIKPPSLYNHVGSGADLTRAVVLESNLRMLAAFQSAVAGVDDPRDQLRALAWAARSWATSNPGLYGLMARTEPENDHPELGPVIRRVLDRFAAPLAAMGVPPADTVHAIRSLRAAIHGFVMLEVSGQFQLADDVESSYRWLVEAVLRGLQGSSGR